MTIDIPDFDEKLQSCGSILLNGVCHAMVTTYDDDGQHQATECGVRLPPHPFLRPNVVMGPRGDFTADEAVDMCPECWPPDVVEQRS